MARGTPVLARWASPASIDSAPSLLSYPARRRQNRQPLPINTHPRQPA